MYHKNVTYDQETENKMQGINGVFLNSTEDGFVQYSITNYY